MSPNDLLFLAAVLATFFGIARILYLLIRRRSAPARRALGWTIGGVALYVAVLVAVSLQSETKRIALNQDLCFDDWCLAVEKSEHMQRDGEEWYEVTLRVSSRARRVRQRAPDVEVWLADNRRGMHPPVESHGPELSQLLEPMGAFRTIRRFRLAGGLVGAGVVVHHGYWPGRLIVGNSQSFLHRPILQELE